MATNETARGVQRIRYDLRFRLLEVVRAQELGPRMRRITLGGDQLEGFRSEGFGDHVKLFFPRPGEERPVMPTLGDDGRPVPPPGGGKPVRRDFTPRRYDAAKGELDVDFVLHGDEGPASAWAAQAAPGSLVGVAGPRGSKIYSPDFDWYVLGGDETALPAIGRWLEGLRPGVPATVLIEVDGADDELELATQADAQVRWLHRDGAAPGTTTLLAGALSQLDLPAGEGFAWFAGEALSLRPLRRHLRDERGFDADHAEIDGYWKRGTAEHDHHEPIE
jgi:NADPH-dependent ferric siderophore reductase